ncbi:MAG: cytochrome c3 family protein [Anaeromyxobacter sp.]
MVNAPARLLLGLGCALLLAPPARADLFSPGELSRAHQALEGIGSCTKCHEAGQQLSAAACLSCHGELRSRVAQGRGLHGRLSAADKASCQTCHHEHLGRDNALVDWGAGGQKRFDHGRTGFALNGKHRTADCARCHDPRLVADAGVKEVLAKQPGRKTFLGAPTACASCHVDEHRGQVGTDCARCHGEEAWRPVRAFDHARTAFPLTGKHQRVDCAKCHKPAEAPPAQAAAGQVGPRSANTMTRLKGIPFAACTDCHKDPHQDRFGQGCASCHTTSDWRKVGASATGERAFHDKTRYPLRGQHATVACAACHGAPARYKGLAFGACTDCHADAHVGQLAAAPPAGATGAAARPRTGPPDCARCHTVDGFLPARFEVEDHDALAYRLEGAHRAVACNACHVRDPKLADKVPAAVRADLQKRKRPVRVSLARLDLPRPADCRSCHKDPHGGQFDARVKAEGCTACHGLESFQKVRFDHGRDTRFPLLGKHAQAACASCHRPDDGGVVRYKPVAVTCAGCHADPHAAQFAVKGKGTDCARCHAPLGWKEGLIFAHANPFTTFLLEGKHKTVGCAQCHPTVSVAGTPTRRYRPLPTKCQGCHADFHQGAFKGYVP